MEQMATDMIRIDIPEELQAQLLYWRETLTAGAWAVGDITNLIWENYQDTPGASKMAVYRAVAIFTGDSARTVRYWAATAAFYPPEERVRYGVLSFAHFALAMSYRERWREVMEYALDFIDQYNRPPAVDALAAKYRYLTLGALSNPPEEPDGNELWERPAWEGEAPIPQMDAPMRGKAGVLEAIKVIERELSQMRIEQDTRRRIWGLIEEARSLLEVWHE